VQTADAPDANLDRDRLRPVDLALVALHACFVRLTAKEASVLHALLLRHDRFVTAEELIATIWPGAAPGACKARLYTNVCTLRRKLGDIHAGVAIDSNRSGYRLSLPGPAPA
jgi:DNA-binding SARP family transcriptional activator